MKKMYKIITGLCVTALAVIPAISGTKNLADSQVNADTTLTQTIPGVPASYSSAIEALKEMNIVSGFEDGELHGERNLTRAQFAKILANAFSENSAGEISTDFSDLEENHWAFNTIHKAVNAGWLKGFDDGSFRPDNNITYEQALTVICRILGISHDRYSYPEDYVIASVENAISNKVNALIGEDITREEAARIILNALEYETGDIESDDSYTMPKSYASVSYAPQINESNAMTDAEMPAEPTGSSGGGGGGSIGVYPHYFPGAFNTEEYTSNEENVFKNTITSPLSTFSIDTDTASYSNLRRFILNGENIPNGSVRTEELINYFDYEKASTEPGKPFGVNYSVAKCPWNEDNLLAMLTISGEELTTYKPSNIVFLVDISGSMYSRNKLPLVKQALSMLLDKLGENDKISIVTYASGTGVKLEPTPATEKEKILGVINSLSAGGGTYGASGINLAYEQAEKFKIDGNNRIILCTDGDFNIGITSTGDLEKLIEEKRQSGIFLSVLGFGMGNYKDNRMETLADKGNGNYAYIDNLREAKKVLVDEMSKTIYTIAKDVKLQVEFNPGKVSQYRLIGYENRLLNNEDFNNDTKDAGELGAGATVTVLYEIIPGNADTDSALKYQTSKIKESDELMTVNIRYKLPGEDESILTQYPVGSEISETTPDDFRFAAAVAELGMILNDSEFKGSSNLDSVISLAKDALGEDKFGIRSEFIQLVDLLRYRKANPDTQRSYYDYKY